MTELAIAVVSITRTARRRFFWAAWWTAPPQRDPFRKPDASHGGAGTREEALADARKAAARALVEIEARWARAWSRVLRELPPFTAREPDDRAVGGVKPLRATPGAAESLWTILGVASDASLEEIKQAYHRRALQTHPDHGGDGEHFMALQQAYEKAVLRRGKTARRPKKRA